MSKIFSLEGKGLKLDTAVDLEKHIADLKNDNDVQEVRFHGNTLGVEACEALAKVLESKPTLQDANLADIFTSRLLSEIPPALHSLLTACLKLPKLHTINLSDNAFGLNTVEPLRPFLSQHTPLQHLILNNNGLGPQAGSYVAQALEKVARKKDQARKSGDEVPHLETIVCGRNRLEAGSMESWVKAYQVNNKVRSVKMVQNGIRQQGIALLLQQGLSHCTELEVLDLQDNTFTALGARALADVLPKWTKLKELGVGDSLLSARGGVMLGDALAKGQNKELEVLRLQYNEIDQKGLKAIVAAAKSSALPRLRRVELNGNKFNEDDTLLEELRDVLSSNKEKHADSYHGVDEDDEEAWGIDELDDLEDEDEDEEDDAEDEEDAEEESIVKQADEAESQPVAQEKDKEVDDLANALNKTEIK